MRSIIRYNDATTQNVVFTNSAATTGGFAMNVFAGAMLLVSATSTGSAITLTFLTKNRPEDADAFTVADSSNAPVTLAVQPGRAYALPDQLFAANYVMATTASGTVTCRVVTKA